MSRWHVIVPLAAALAAGYVLYRFGLTVGWLVGSLVVTATHNIMARRPWSTPPALRSLGQFLLGVATGALLTREVVSFVLTNWLAVVIALSGAIASGIICGRFFMLRGRVDAGTAYCATAAGGAAELAGLASSLGADDRLVASYHTLRVSIVIVSVSLLTPVLLPGQLPGPDPLHIDWREWLAAAPTYIAAIPGVMLARRLRLPGATIMGAVITVGVLSLLNIPVAPLPRELRYVAQVLIGAAIGTTFTRATLDKLRSLFSVCVASLGLLFGLTFIWAGTLHLMTGISFLTAILSVVPGGASDMVIIAMGLGGDASTVAGLQTLRLVTIALTSPLIIRRLARARLAQP